MEDFEYNQYLELCKRLNEMPLQKEVLEALLFVTDCYFLNGDANGREPKGFIGEHKKGVHK